ncbi:MAG: cold shock domain-containing protein [Acidimicrobiia bacterium]|nr:cold shock domain-containing protein [Acidimicrobiia bacterium]
MSQTGGVRSPGKIVECRAMQGVVKLYDPNTGVGVVVLDEDRSEVYIRAGSLAGSVFRLLRQGQRIVFEVEESDGLRFIHSVRMGSDGR